MKNIQDNILYKQIIVIYNVDILPQNIYMRIILENLSSERL